MDRQVLIAALIEIERRRADLNADGILCQDEIDQIAQSLAPWELRGGLSPPSDDRDGQQQDSEVRGTQEHQRIPGKEKRGPQPQGHLGRGGGINELLDFRFKPEVDLTFGPYVFAYDRVYACLHACMHAHVCIVCMHAYVCIVCMHACIICIVCMYVCRHACMHVCMFSHT